MRDKKLKINIVYEHNYSIVQSFYVTQKNVFRRNIDLRTMYNKDHPLKFVGNLERPVKLVKSEK